MESNNMAMREALEAALPIMRNCVVTHFDTTEVDAVVAKMDSALSAPPRNCDVGTAEEQKKRFDSFCVSRYTSPDENGAMPDGCDCPCYVRGKGCNAFAWAQMPYEEGVAK